MDENKRINQFALSEAIIAEHSRQIRLIGPDM
jgi:hypothetical protein